jgi:hypothetical protein
MSDEDKPKYFDFEGRQRQKALSRQNDEDGWHDERLL